MLLFISTHREARIIGRSFNTSHVTLYRVRELISGYRAGVSIHLMLLFISNNRYKRRQSTKFQYISCYSLSRRCFKPSIFECVSIHLMLLFIVFSPATLSRLKIVSIHLMLLFIAHPQVTRLLFQYISCYSLSNVQRRNWPRRIRFNTSHVTLYLRYLGHRS